MKLRIAVARSLVCLGLAASPALGQKVPNRPRLAEGADTNSALAYYAFGLGVVGTDPETAADAFYWSARLEPAMASAYYARRVALLLEDRYRLLRYWRGDQGTIKSKDIKQIDSLYYHALTLNPFVAPQLDHYIFDGVLDEISRQLEQQTGASASDIRFELDKYMFDAPADLRAWQARSQGRPTDALKLYATAIDAADFKAPLRIERAAVFYETNALDSALVELTTAAQEMRKRDDKDLVYVYDSKALLDERIAVVDLRLGKLDASREALGQALQEDLSFYPAHVYLALLAMQSNDSATALNEMDLAVQLRPDDPAPQFTYGSMLVNAGRLDDAEPHLREAIKLDNVYAAPHFVLAVLLDQQGHAADAMAEYATFLSTAAATDGRRAAAQARVTALRAATPGGHRSQPESR